MYNVGVLQDAPYLQLKQNSDEFEGFIPDLIANLSRKTRFNYEIRLVRDGRYGSRTSNGSWNGMIGELISRVAYLYFLSFICSVNLAANGCN